MNPVNKRYKSVAQQQSIHKANRAAVKGEVQTAALTQVGLECILWCLTHHVGTSCWCDQGTASKACVMISAVID